MAYTRQAVEALRLAHKNKLAPIDPKGVIRAAPMATQQLCNAAKAQLIQVYKESKSPNFDLYSECLRAR
jgi:hypothetical protein